MSARSERRTPVQVHGWLALPLIGVFIALGVLAVGVLLLPFALFTLSVRVRLRFGLRRAFPEVFIDPAALTRISAEPDPDDH